MTETRASAAPKRPGPDADPNEAILVEALLAESVAGQSVLNIGSDRGRLPLLALEKGAAKVTMLNANRLNLDAARDAARSAGFSPDYIFGKWEAVCGGIGAYDVIVCSLTANAARDPVATIRQMMARTRKRLIIAADCYKWGDGIPYALALLNRVQPMIWLPKPEKPGRLPHRSFLFNPAAIRSLFTFQSTLFEPIRVLRRPRAGRFVVEARRRHVHNLVVIAGPSSAGKSTFIKSLTGDPNLRREFGLSGEWKFIRGRDVAHLPAGNIENMLVELDLMAVERGDLAGFDDIPQFQILRAAENLKVLTILPLHPKGQIRMSLKEIDRLGRRCGALGESLINFYTHQGDSTLVRHLYAAWFDWVTLGGAREMRIIVNDFVSFVSRPIEDFDRLFDGALARAD